MHVEEEKLEQLLSGELPEHEGRVLGDHLQQCGLCADAFEAAERNDREIANLLMALDHPVPRVDADQLMHRARRRTYRPRLVAAGIALLIVAGGASAMPGSPIRSWLSRVLAGTSTTQATPSAAKPEDAAERLPSGVSVVPAARFELNFEAVQAVGLIQISLADQAELAVRSDSEGVGYLIEPQGVKVLNVGSAANYEVVIPRSAGGVIVRVQETIVFQKQGEAIVIPATDQADGRYIIDFSALSTHGD